MIYVHRLQPKAMVRVWSHLRYGIEQSMPPTAKKDSGSVINILAELLCDAAQCWVVYSEEGSEIGLHAFAITYLRTDPLTKNKYLHVYTLYGFKPLTRETWARISAVILKFAKGHKCTAVTTFTNNPVVSKMVESMGGSKDWEYWYKEL